MSAATAAPPRRWKPVRMQACAPQGVELLAGYDQYVDGLPIDVGVRWARRRAARAFLADHCDLPAWMRRPTPARLGDLHRADA